jgi:dTMP kinase
MEIIGLKKGFFITFEGEDAVGKSQHAELLKQALQMRGFNVKNYRSPGGTALGETIRTIVKDRKNKICDAAELFLLNADRAQLVQHEIIPSLDDGNIVICDRFHWSGVVYQGFGRGIDMSTVDAVIRHAISGIVPDITFLLTVDDAEKSRRKRNRDSLDRFEAEKEEYQAKISEGFAWLKSKEKESNGKLIVINTSEPVETVHNEIYRCVAYRVSQLNAGQLKLDLAKKIIV